ncbi:ATP-binding protein [Micromonospora chokoriensis]|uniref:ATP-binding protein n=1 Tax=Micromonospora chokoriensis TaxID=356851 RepID=UPI0004C37405|nr:helix-turn-helix domain-containing protein [Micromonospora chokoriensis]
MTPDHDRSRSPAGRTTLPELLRGHRRAAGLTQAELASRAGVGVRTVRDLERGRSMRPQRTTVELLAAALALSGTSRAAFLAAARGAESAPPDASTTFAVSGTTTSTAAPADPPVALPPPVALIGRERDLTELAEMLTAERGPRLVSLVGLAGVGKTALATSVAHLVASAHPAGVAGVLVGEGADGPDVLAASMSVLGVARLSELVALLAGRPALLVMDAVERSPGPVAATLHRLIGALPSLRVLVTGRHPVGLPGERVWPVAPLDVPPPDAEHSGPSTLGSWPAVALFTARLAQVRREPPTPAELPALAALVRRLGGLPLAIELMAARGRLLDLTELLERYGDRVLDLATPADASAHPGWDASEALTRRASRSDTRAAVAVTLRDAVAFSYRLLAPDERAALRQLAVFGNRWSVELAEEMLAAEADRDGTVAIDPVPLLDRFVELGLLSVRGTGSFRFRLLDAVRDYAVEQAAGGGELNWIRRRHAEVIARLVARTASDLVGPRLPDAVHRLDEMSSDISSSLAHAATDDPLTALRLAACLTRWWRFRGRDVAGRQWLRRLLADPRTAEADPLLRGWAALGVARLAAEHGAGAEELSTARAALDIFRQAGDVTGELEARNVLGTLLISVGRQDEAREQAEALLRLAARNGRTRDLAVAQNSLAWHEIRAGDLAAARRRLAAVDRLAGESGEPRLRVLGWANRAEVARLEGWYADAIDRGRRAIAALSELGDPGRRRRVLGTVGLALAQDGRVAEATEVLTELRAGRVEVLPMRPTVPRPRSDDAALAWGGPEAGLCALIEGNLALHRGDRELAAEWFAAAADDAGQDRRDVVEALVGLAASTADPAVLDRLDRACLESGIRLLPQESGLLYALTAARGGPAAQ